MNELSELQKEIVEAVRNSDGKVNGREWASEHNITEEEFREAVDTDEMYRNGVEFGVSPLFPWDNGFVWEDSKMVAREEY